MAEGLVGMDVRPLSWTILLTMLSSFLSAVVVVPWPSCGSSPRRRRNCPSTGSLARFRAFYRRVMPGLLRRPGRVVSVGVACFLAAILLASQMEFVLMPDNYDGSVSLEATFRSGYQAVCHGRADPGTGGRPLEDPNFEKVTLSASENTATFYRLRGGWLQAQQ